MNKEIDVKRVHAELKSPSEIALNVGLIVLSTDEIGAEAFHQILPHPAARLFVTRTAYVDESAEGGEFRLRDSFKSLADTFPPSGALDVLAFNCTSGTVAVGKEKILSQLSEARPGLKYTTPAVAGTNALKFLGVQRMVLLTPYPSELHKQFLPYFRRDGFDIVSDATFGLSTDRQIGHLSKHSIFQASKELTASGLVDGIFISCTGISIVSNIQELEGELGIPVVTSTQALAWDALRLGGYREPVQSYGKLLSMPR